MQTYECHRCGKQFGSPSAVRMHLRNKHAHKEVCDRCGIEIFKRSLNEHLLKNHPCESDVPSIYKPLPTTKVVRLKPQDDEQESFWEVPDARLPCFTAPETLLRCRSCGKMLGSVHGREQHEKKIHHFTTQVRNSLALRLQPWNFLDYLSPSDVKEYMDTDLKPKLSDSLECNHEVNILVDFLIQELPLKVTHVVRGGSYGKGTCLKGHSDIDMVIFIEGFPLFGGTFLSNNRLSACLQGIKMQLQRSLLATRTLVAGVTSHSLRFQYKCVKNDHIYHIDLMPCNDLLGFKPTLDDKMSIYDLIGNCKSQHERQLLNASLLQLQIDFVRHRPRIVRDLIRLVKHWKNTAFGKITSLNRYKRLPNSFTMELITIHAWEQSGKPIMFNLRRGLASVLQLLTNYEDLCVVWYDNYTAHNRWVRETLAGIRPIVVDPANPVNNVCSSSNCWDEVGYVAKQSLKKPFFKNMKQNGQWN